MDYEKAKLRTDADDLTAMVKELAMRSERLERHVEVDLLAQQVGALATRIEKLESSSEVNDLTARVRKLESRYEIPAFMKKRPKSAIPTEGVISPVVDTAIADTSPLPTVEAQA